MRTKKIKFRLNDREYYLLKMFIQKNGITTSDLVRFFIDSQSSFHKKREELISKEIIKSLYLSIRRLNALQISPAAKKIYDEKISNMVEEVLIYLED